MRPLRLPAECAGPCCPRQARRSMMAHRRTLVVGAELLREADVVLFQRCGLCRGCLRVDGLDRTGDGSWSVTMGLEGVWRRTI
jgi:hypothetical protein